MRNSKHLSAKENGLLLMLYFGPDSQSNEDNASNSGKNNEIYKLISESLNLVEKLYSKENNKELKDEINSRIEYVEILQDNLPSLRTEEREVLNDDGSLSLLPVEIYDESTPQYLAYLKEKNQLDRFIYENSPQKLESLLDKLTDEIRTYLKIEWDVAKKRK